ncbi:hypothetical protein ACFSR9_05890 [Deinococcus taklimakanensis]|uniref:Uncharacterized protein n=1 Tax=Deinococcus taklimakanensis TaxID=536443 RepID=A0ABW5P3H0_9DEIO
MTNITYLDALSAGLCIEHDHIPDAGPLTDLMPIEEQEETLATYTRLDDLGDGRARLTTVYLPPAWPELAAGARLSDVATREEAERILGPTGWMERVYGTLSAAPDRAVRIAAANRLARSSEVTA